MFVLLMDEMASWLIVVVVAKLCLESADGISFVLRGLLSPESKVSGAGYCAFYHNMLFTRCGLHKKNTVCLWAKWIVSLLLLLYYVTL